MRLRTKGQSTLEYSILIAIVVAALLAMQIYMKRGVEGRLKSTTDDIGEQFEAGNTTYTHNQGRTGISVERTATGVTSTFGGRGGNSGLSGVDNIGQMENVTRHGNETVGNW